MRTILIAQRDVGFATSLAVGLMAGGYRIVACPGPWPPRFHCIRHDAGYCPITEAADLMIYAPEMTGVDDDGTVHNLAVDSANAHPDVPMLLAWPADTEPASVEAILREAPTARRADEDPEALLAQVRALVGAPHTPDYVPRPADGALAPVAQQTP